MNKVLEYLKIIYNKINFFTLSMFFLSCFWFLYAGLNSIILIYLNIDILNYENILSGEKLQLYYDYLNFFEISGIMVIICFLLGIYKLITNHKKEK